MSSADNDKLDKAQTSKITVDKVTLSPVKRVFGWVKQLVIFILFAIVITGVMDVWRGKDIPRDNLPDLKGVTLSGTDIDIDKLSQDQSVLVYFWGTWCPVCNFVSPAVSFASEYFPVVSVAMNSGADEKMVKYLEHKGYEFETINDSDNEIARDWSVQLTPTLMVFKDGELTHYTTGFTSLPGIWWRMLLS
ncbi:MAG: thiol-disulfide isomerase/thioredoxin [Shewanella sp.]|jgi:thiol-disulfide isomerase/thioredoxin